MSDKKILIPNLGYVGTQDGFHILESTEDGRFTTGKNGVVDIVSTGDE